MMQVSTMMSSMVRFSGCRRIMPFDYCAGVFARLKNEMFFVSLPQDEFVGRIVDFYDEGKTAAHKLL